MKINEMFSSKTLNNSKKRITNTLRISISLVFIIIASFSFSSCKNETKYTYDKYEDISYGNFERQTLNLYLPKQRSGTIGLIVVIHGGAWIGGDKNDCNQNLDKWCETYGYATAAINYHYISSEFSCNDIMQDIALSLNKIKEFATSKNYNIEKAMLVGSSAGGHLSLLYAYKHSNMASIKPVAVANYSGPTDLTDKNYYENNENGLNYLELFSNLCHEEFTLDNYLSKTMQEKLLEYSPVNYVNESSVPTLICHGDIDDIVPYSNAVILKEKLDSFNIKSDFLSYKNSGHSLSGDKKQSKKNKILFEEYANNYLE